MPTMPAPPRCPTCDLTLEELTQPVVERPELALGTCHDCGVTWFLTRPEGQEDWRVAGRLIIPEVVGAT
jgi:hypothetical protein